MLWRILFFFSIVPIIASTLARWWFAKRVLISEGIRACTCDPRRWESHLGLAPIGNRASALEFAVELRKAALMQWKERDPKAASNRENARRFGKAVPPFSLLVAVFALIIAKIPVMGAVAILLASTAISAALGLLTLGPELRAIAITSRRLRDAHLFPRREDEEAVVKTAVAKAWEESIPPILRWL